MKDSIQHTASAPQPIVRIAPVCNGKIYVIPRTSSNGQQFYMDLPIEEETEIRTPRTGKAARKVMAKYRPHLSTDATPRFSVQYHSRPPLQESVCLYILPLKEEHEISFRDGRFVSAEEIETSPQLFSRKLQEESALLGMAAELWDSDLDAFNI